MERPLTATERAYRFAKAGILDGSLPAGELISEGQIARPLELSRTPVREAFLQLQAEGLLRLFPKRGALVVPVSPDEVEAVIEARQVIESYAATELVRRTDAMLEEVTSQMQECIDEQVRADADGRGMDFVEADRRFHTLLVRSTCGSILVDVYEGLRDRQVRMNLGAIVRVAGRSEQILADHRAFLALLRARDSETAVATLAVHLDGTRRGAVGGPAWGGRAG
ncbi:MULTISPECIES: GntR family transcriptional regulator [Pseudonocardia]|uniref:Transcriptional regulator, GntR family protein n=1 Tax=Pseudonocardia saturnea TaxID=33909 RepID=A0ABQ0S7U7_9PSEU|nr:MULTISPECIES: GntR family transcriptional regulator [Pseudonocardia]BBG04720.1 putative transcriptional regulator, GntR family protein [Pseudonocardia autotrophica]GEC28931.1 putative transcriptional regulator, GntR family protein [Pseudonocardia saturnea]